MRNVQESERRERPIKWNEIKEWIWIEDGKEYLTSGWTVTLQEAKDMIFIFKSATSAKHKAPVQKYGYKDYQGLYIIVLNYFESLSRYYLWMQA